MKWATALCGKIAALIAFVLSPAYRGLENGDAFGLEVFQPHESPVDYGPNGLEFRDARTGALIFGVQGGTDIGRGIAVDVDPRFRGYEMWGLGPTGGMYTAQQSVPNPVLGPGGVQISASKPSINHAVWWDGDLLRELLDGTTISKWNWNTGTAPSILSPSGIASNNGTKAGCECLWLRDGDCGNCDHQWWLRIGWRPGERRSVDQFDRLPPPHLPTIIGYTDYADGTDSHLRNRWLNDFIFELPSNCANHSHCALCLITSRSG